MTLASKVFAIKWLVVPSILAVIGYFGIGPILSGRYAPAKIEAESTTTDPPRRFTTEPEVEVSATPARRRTRAAAPPPEPAPTRNRVRVVDPLPDSQLPDDVTPPPIPEPVDDHSTVPPITTTGGGDGTADPPLIAR